MNVLDKPIIWVVVVALVALALCHFIGQQLSPQARERRKRRRNYRKVARRQAQTSPAIVLNTRLPKP